MKWEKRNAMNSFLVIVLILCLTTSFSWTVFHLVTVWDIYRAKEEHAEEWVWFNAWCVFHILLTIVALHLTHKMELTADLDALIWVPMACSPIPLFFLNKSERAEREEEARINKIEKPE